MAFKYFKMAIKLIIFECCLTNTASTKAGLEFLLILPVLRPTHGSLPFGPLINMSKGFSSKSTLEVAPRALEFRISDPKIFVFFHCFVYCVFAKNQKIWPTDVAAEADTVSSMSASARYIGGPNSVNPGQILLVYGALKLNHSLKHFSNIISKYVK